MPGLKSHDIFYKELKDRLKKEVLSNYPNYDKYNLFVQGHDLMLYNSSYKRWRRKLLKNNCDLSLKMQNYDFSEFVYNYLKLLEKENLLNDESCKAFLMGYISHHIMDAYLHPYIIFYSGDHTPDKNYEEWQHGYVENLLDMYLISVKEKKDHKTAKIAKDFKYKEKYVNKKLYKVFNDAIFLTYGYTNSGKVLRNALKEIYMVAKISKEDRYGIKLKIFEFLGKFFQGSTSLSYHRDLSPVDKYLNKEKKYWVNFNDKTKISDKTFMDLYNESLVYTAEIINDLENIYKKENITREDVNNIVPNISSIHGGKCNLKYEILYKSKIAVKKKSVEKKIIKKIDFNKIINKNVYKYIYSTNSKNFTTRFGCFLRRKFNFIFRKIVKSLLINENIVVKRAKLNKKENYIFICNHSLADDLKLSMATVDRNAYLVLGLTEQMRTNPDMMTLRYLNGMIHTFKESKPSRNDARNKMEKVLKYKSSIIIYPEGAYNHSPNKLILELYDSIFYLSKKTNVKIVPIISYGDLDSNKVFTSVCKPIDTKDYKIEDKEIFMSMLRDKMATEYWYLFEEYAPFIKRSELETLNEYYNKRLKQYLSVLWDPRRNDWIEEEIVSKKDSDKENLDNFKKYVRNNWKTVQEDLYREKTKKK